LRSCEPGTKSRKSGRGYRRGDVGVKEEAPYGVGRTCTMESYPAVPSLSDLWLHPDTADPVERYFWFSIASELIGLLIKRANKNRYERIMRERFRDFVRLKLIYSKVYVDYDEDEPIKFVVKEPDHVKRISTKLFGEFSKSELNEGFKFLTPLRMYVFHVLLTEQRVFTADLAKRLRHHVTKSQISDELVKLSDAGYLKQVGIGHYRLAKTFPIDFLERVAELFDEYAMAFDQDEVQNVEGLIVHDVREKDVIRFAMRLYLEARRRKIKDIVEDIPIVCGDWYMTVKSALELATLTRGDIVQYMRQYSSPIVIMNLNGRRRVCDALEEIRRRKCSVLFKKDGNSYTFIDVSMLRILPPTGSLNVPRL